MAAGDVKLVYPASSAVTITLASLASDTSFLAGRESTLIDNTANKYSDYSLRGLITTGTTPTTGREIRVYVVAIMEDGTWPDVFDGTDSAETVSTAGTRDSICSYARAISTVATSNQAYYVECGSIAALFGNNLPSKFVVFVTHNTGVNLNATAGNHALYIKGSYLNIEA